MKDTTGILLFGVAAVGVYLVYQKVKPAEGDCWFFDVPCQVRNAAKDTANNLSMAWTNTVGAASTRFRASIETPEIIFERIPPTPEGYNPSNWTWELPSGTKLGVPAGMTPAQFCKSSPSSPICAEVNSL